jgi:hypothetical protein
MKKYIVLMSLLAGTNVFALNMDQSVELTSLAGKYAGTTAGVLGLGINTDPCEVTIAMNPQGEAQVLINDSKANNAVGFKLNTGDFVMNEDNHLVYSSANVANEYNASIGIDSNDQMVSIDASLSLGPIPSGSISCRNLQKQ